ncbi:conserved hypothetical protein [Altererythrobacter sp. B11]|uniref:DUF418 domain-containing protein n=1 Tax=Altererythrobacter sp. B11 TaxID=2060312 RepID=UPI000DC703D3|nr:DUF418 domain-containing protein [Altererythrobacter sp. B11]BBC73989.1 conserved hypothetical protein [Altererythrobacter sp. B11]
MPDPSESQTADMTPVVDRIHLIDSLRAAALCGVILFNIVAMVAGFLSRELLLRASPVDLGFAAVDVLLIQGKARSCFALLFGVGFGILMERANSRGQDFTRFYLRRMAVLLAIGLCNLTFLFFGDILILYALLGISMLLFRGWGNRALLVGGLALVVLPPVAQGIAEAAVGGPLPNLAGLGPAQIEGLMPASVQAYRGSSFSTYAMANWRYYLDMYRVHTADTLVYNASVLGLFLLGLWAARSNVLTDIERWRPFLRRVVWWCLPAGLLLSVVQGTRHLGIAAHGAAYGVVTASYAALAFAAFGYIALLCLFLTRGRGRQIQKVLAPMGRMALTGYLASNLIGAFVFYGWGLGSMSRWSITGLCLLGLTIFAGLCAFSAVWLRFFRFGLAEWVWRSLTYGYPQPLLKPRAAVRAPA